MASWMVHLRIADRLLDRIPGLSPLEFVFGNIAPDSGVPTGDFASFDPPKSVSHFHVIENGHRVAGYGAYAEKYLTPDRARLYSGEEYAFYLGYFSHLLTDYLWALEVVRPLMERDAENYANDKAAAVRKWKEDWYDLDFRYLRDHPALRAFSLFSDAAGFENKYLDFFPAGRIFVVTKEDHGFLLGTASESRPILSVARPRRRGQLCRLGDGQNRSRNSAVAGERITARIIKRPPQSGNPDHVTRPRRKNQ